MKEMKAKRTVAAIAAVLLVIVIILTTMTAEAEAVTKYRTQCGKVYCIYECTDNDTTYEVTFKTKDNNYWVYYTDSTQWYPGQKVLIKFNTRGTQKKTDDAIVGIRRR